MRLRYSIKACRPMCILEREREHIGSIWSRVACLDSPLAVAQSLLLEGLDDSRSSQRLNNNDRKQTIQRINKIVHQTVSNYQTNSTKIFYSSLRTREGKNHLNRSYGLKVMKVLSTKDYSVII
jgi:hypothetical protein